jgi:hypothetical protein
MINVVRARGRKNTEIAAALKRPLSTVERWIAEAKKNKKAALAELDTGAEIHDALWFATFVHRSTCSTPGSVTPGATTPATAKPWTPPSWPTWRASPTPTG